MKFDVVIGNPPYQEKTQGNRTSDRSIYHLFMEMGFALARVTTMITPARFLFDAGDTPSEFNNKMLHDPNFKVVYYKWDSSKIFPRTQIKGGVAITLRDSDKNFGEIGQFFVLDGLKPIFEKVKPSIENQGSLRQIISTSNRLNLDALYADFPEAKKIVSSNGKERRLQSNIFTKLSIFTSKPAGNDHYKIYGVVKNKRTSRYVNQKYIEPSNVIDSYNILMPKSSGNGEFGEKLADSILCRKGEGFTYTFIGIGNFDTEVEANNAEKYLRTKFARAMLGVLKVTQDNTPEKWQGVPLQDFTDKSDIHWNVQVEDIDQQLFKKYGFQKHEIAFIEDHVQGM